MNCERCQGYEFDRVADLGGAMMVRCKACGHQQIIRQQAPRGQLVRGGITQAVVAVSGEID